MANNMIHYKNIQAESVLSSIVCDNGTTIHLDDEGRVKDSNEFIYPINPVKELVLSNVRIHEFSDKNKNIRRRRHISDDEEETIARNQLFNEEQNVEDDCFEAIEETSEEVEKLKELTKFCIEQEAPTKNKEKKSLLMANIISRIIAVVPDTVISNKQKKHCRRVTDTLI